MRLRHPASQLKTALLDLLFPLRCFGCGSEGDLLCESCRRSLYRIEPPFCQRCGTQLGERSLCRVCIRHPLTIDGIRSLFTFEGTVRQAIHQFKYSSVKMAAVPLGQMLADFLRSQPLSGDVLMPVPLYRKRLRERGYNQASLLTTEIGKHTGLPVAEASLVRVRDTLAQARTVSAAERRENVRGAFGCRERLRGENIILIDDVCTTGATLDACATALKAAGAGSVRGLTIAREAVAPAIDTKKSLKV